MSDDISNSNLRPWIDPELEARIVALVLGEASDFEREELERMMAEDSDLAAYHQRIASVHGLLGQIVPGEKQGSVELSPAIRDNLLAAFEKEPALPIESDQSVADDFAATDDPAKPIERIPRADNTPATSAQRMRRLLAIAAVVIGLAFIASLTMPAYNRVSSKSALHYYGDSGIDDEKAAADADTRQFDSSNQWGATTGFAIAPEAEPQLTTASASSTPSPTAEQANSRARAALGAFGEEDFRLYALADKKSDSAEFGSYRSDNATPADAMPANDNSGRFNFTSDYEFDAEGDAAPVGHGGAAVDSIAHDKFAISAGEATRVVPETSLTSGDANRELAESLVTKADDNIAYVQIGNGGTTTQSRPPAAYSIDLNLTPEIVEFEGFINQAAEGNAQSLGRRQVALEKSLAQNTEMDRQKENATPSTSIFEREFLGGANALRGFRYQDVGPQPTEPAPAEHNILIQAGNDLVVFPDTPEVGDGYAGLTTSSLDIADSDFISGGDMPLLTRPPMIGMLTDSEGAGLPALVQASPAKTGKGQQHDRFDVELPETRRKLAENGSNANPPAVEQLGAGGFDSVRGFEERLARAYNANETRDRSGEIHAHDADGSGGFIMADARRSGDTTTIDGAVAVNSLGDTSGGSVTLLGESIGLGPNADLSADGGVGGAVIIGSADEAKWRSQNDGTHLHYEDYRTIEASGATTGGMIAVTGGDVSVSRELGVTANGGSGGGGGSINIGGNFQGNTASVDSKSNAPGDISVLAGVEGEEMKKISDLVPAIVGGGRVEAAAIVIGDARTRIRATSGLADQELATEGFKDIDGWIASSDGESSKASVNIHADGTAWDTPRAGGDIERSLGRYEPAQHESQYYPEAPIAEAEARARPTIVLDSNFKTEDSVIRREVLHASDNRSDIEKRQTPTAAIDGNTNADLGLFAAGNISVLSNVRNAGSGDAKAITTWEEKTDDLGSEVTALSSRGSRVSVDSRFGNTEALGLEEVRPEIQITSKFVEVDQSQTAEQGFDWLVNQSPASNPITAGLRSGGFAVSDDSIDGLIASAAGTAAAAPSSPPDAFGVAGVMTDLQYGAVQQQLPEAPTSNLWFGTTPKNPAPSADHYAYFDSEAKAGQSVFFSTPSPAPLGQTPSELSGDINVTAHFGSVIQTGESRPNIEVIREFGYTTQHDAPEFANQLADFPDTKTRATRLSLSTALSVTEPSDSKLLGYSAPQSDNLQREKNASYIPAPAGLDETSTADEAFSTFSLHVSDVSFKLAQTALAKGEWPDAERIRVEEFVNAFDYGDPLPSLADKVACQMEQSIHPFLQQRNLLRLSMRTAAAGRSQATPLHLTLVLDHSGSMERHDRRQTVQLAFEQLAGELTANDTVNVIGFARQPRLLVDRVSGDARDQLLATVSETPSEGGTHLESALDLAFEKARELAQASESGSAQNRIILLTDGAANLGDADPDRLAQKVEAMREAGIAFDAAGIGADGLNDEILEALTRKGDGRYYLLDQPEDADEGFARQIAGALRPAAMNVKVQIEFNPERVASYKLLGFEKHRLNKEDFRDDSVDAAEIAAEEAGVAVYQFEPLADGKGDVGTAFLRFRDMSSGQMVEKRWPINYAPDAPRPDQASPKIRLATAAALFATRLKGDTLGETVELSELSHLLDTLPEQLRNLERVQLLRTMIEQARNLQAQ